MNFEVYQIAQRILQNSPKSSQSYTRITWYGGGTVPFYLPVSEGKPPVEWTKLQKVAAIRDRVASSLRGLGLAFKEAILKSIRSKEKLNSRIGKIK